MLRGALAFGGRCGGLGLVHTGPSVVYALSVCLLWGWDSCLRSARWWVLSTPTDDYASLTSSAPKSGCSPIATEALVDQCSLPNAPQLQQAIEELVEEELGQQGRPVDLTVLGELGAGAAIRRRRETELMHAAQDLTTPTALQCTVQTTHLVRIACYIDSSILLTRCLSSDRRAARPPVFSHTLHLRSQCGV